MRTHDSGKVMANVTLCCRLPGDDTATLQDRDEHDIDTDDILGQKYSRTILILVPQYSTNNQESHIEYELKTGADCRCRLAEFPFIILGGFYLMYLEEGEEKEHSKRLLEQRPPSPWADDYTHLRVTPQAFQRRRKDPSLL